MLSTNIYEVPNSCYLIYLEQEGKVYLFFVHLYISEILCGGMMLQYNMESLLEFLDWLDTRMKAIYVMHVQVALLILLEL